MSHKSNKNNVEKEIKNWIEKIISFLTKVDEMLENGDFKEVSKKSLMISLDQEGENFEQSKLKELIDLHEEAIKNTPFFQFDWRDLSSGEKALLNIYSRFYSIADRNLKDNLIILIDEGELYLHPQWQKKYLYNLIEFLPEIYPNKQIQIILTSHSPFVISDLPNSNIIFLKQGENNECKIVDKLEDNNRTFAANIHNLFSDSFFMQGSLVGNFAKYKINKLINLLLDAPDYEIKENKNKIRKIINIIGEPVIRNKLLNMLKERVEASYGDYIDIDDKIEDLQQQINELKRKKEND